MRLCHLCLAILLSACTKPAPSPILAPHAVPPDLLRGCAGYRGPLPRTEGDFAKAIVAEAQGRACANARLATVGEILSKPDQDDS
ncbi:MAG: hypothetical protein ACJARR_002648 [Pseudophaeobacter arcticus]|jgi:hypothetical protein